MNTFLQNTLTTGKCLGFPAGLSLAKIRNFWFKKPCLADLQTMCASNAEYSRGSDCRMTSVQLS